jgi:amino acid transporter
MADSKEQSFDVGSKPASFTEKGHRYSPDLGEDGHSGHGEVKTVQLKRKLQSRHLQMIAIGGTIGTGLFIGSGSALSTAGPASTLIAYAFVGTLVYSVMVALGEMATFIPVSGAFTTFAARFVDPSLGFAMGWYVETV